MARRKTKVKAKVRKIRGRGDYDIFSDPGGPVPVKQNPIKSLESRVSKLESRVPKPKSSVGKAAGLGGRLLGSLIGQGDLGETAATEVAKWFGHGDYHLKGNSLVSAVASGGSVTGAKFDNDGRRGTRITEREYIGDIFSGSLSGGSTIFNNDTYTINPGDAKTFPWLHIIASQFEEYVPHGIMFEFISTSSTFNGASQALGTVIMATDYDPDDPSYITKIEMENADYSNSMKASSNGVHGIECDVSERAVKTLYVRTGEIGTQPRKFYDLGNFQIATFGMSTSNVNLGELWVSYDITFYKKQVNSSLYGNYLLNACLTSSKITALSTPLGTENFRYAGNLRVTMDTNTIYFPSSLVTGKYRVEVFVHAEDYSADVGGTYTPTLFNCSLFSISSYYPMTNARIVWANSAADNFGGNYAVSPIVYMIQIDGPNATIRVPNLALVDPSVATKNNFVNVFITQVPFSTQSAYV